MMTGVGAAGIATADILLHAGARNVIGADRERRRLPRPRRPHAAKAAFAERSNPDGEQGTADELLAGADVFIGLSAPGAVSAAGVAHDGEGRDRLRDGQPDPRGRARGDRGLVAVVGTGRSDYPNQINNVLAFPGVFRGALDVRASAITEGMKVAASHALATVIPDDELGPEYVIPGVFNRDVAPARRGGGRRGRRARRRRARRSRG